MISTTRTAGVLQTARSSMALSAPQKEARQCLNKITLLQAKLNIAEKNLRDLLKVHGLQVLR